MRSINDLAIDALDDAPFSDYDEDKLVEKEINFMKVKTTFYNHNVGLDFDPVIRVSYPTSRADQLSYTPTGKLVDQMFRTGQMVQASKQNYDFADGVDDGRDVPVDRMRGLDYPEISQAMAESEAKLKAHKKNLSEMSARKRKEQESAEKAKRSAGEGEANGASADADGGKA